MVNPATKMNDKKLHFKSSGKKVRKKLKSQQKTLLTFVYSSHLSPH
jgi:hypothetical protein